MIIFDLDGTLVDSAPEITASMRHAWSTVMPELPFPSKRYHIGPPLLQAVAELAPELPPEKHQAIAAAFRQHYDLGDLSGTRPFEGIVDLLASLAKTPMCIATNKRRVPTQTIVDRWFSGRFGRIARYDAVWPDDGTRPEGKVRMLEWLTSSSGTPPASAVMVGDAATDVSAARALGMPSIAVTWGYEDEATLRRAGPDELVHDVPGLLAALEKARARA